MEAQTFFQWLLSVGTPAQVALFTLIFITLIKVWPILQKNVLDAQNSREGRYGQRISDLERDLRRCHEECQERINHLDKIIAGMRTQRSAEQIAMMRAILRTVEDPGLRKQLELLEALSMTTEPAKVVNGPIEDGDKEC